jgi:hypothetical protein
MSEVACPLRIVRAPRVGRHIPVAAESLDQREVEKLALDGFPVANPDRPLIRAAVDDEWASVRRECGPSPQLGTPPRFVIDRSVRLSVNETPLDPSSCAVPRPDRRKPRDFEPRRQRRVVQQGRRLR